MSSSDDDITDKAKQLAKDYREIDHFETHETEMDEISELALEYSKTIYELGMSGEARMAAEIFNASATMLKISMDARQQKLEKKLKLMKLEMDQMKFDKANSKEPDEPEVGNVKVLDRNELLSMLKDIHANPNPVNPDQKDK
jgi:hypothetical protein